MTYLLSDSLSIRDRNIALYEMVAEKLKEERVCPLPPFSLTLFSKERETLWMKWPNGVSVHLSIFKGQPFCYLEMSVPNGIPYRKEISVTFDELIDRRLVEIVPGDPYKHFYWHYN